MSNLVIGLRAHLGQLVGVVCSAEAHRVSPSDMGFSGRSHYGVGGNPAQDWVAPFRRCASYLHEADGRVEAGGPVVGGLHCCFDLEASSLSLLLEHCQGLAYSEGFDQ